MSSLSYSPNKQFGLFWNQLRKQAPGEWTWLIEKFRKRLIPWLRTKTYLYPMNAGQTRTQFIEEVFEESLFKFYDLLHAGTFNSYNDLEAMIVTICSYKLKEGFVRLKKERRLYCVEADQLNYLREAQYANELASQQKQEELLMLVHQKMLLLPYEDREILNSFFEGQELNDIAKSLSISSAACRKRKQRALDKLRSLVFQSHKALKYDQPIPERATKRNETVFAQSAFR